MAEQVADRDVLGDRWLLERTAADGRSSQLSCLRPTSPATTVVDSDLETDARCSCRAGNSVLVLEAGGPALAAFDLDANPIKQFGSGASSSASLLLNKDKTYLDISVDGAEQIYLLHHTTPAGGTLQPKDFGVDVLGPDGTPITTNSTGVNAAHLPVDYWRSIYAANYAPLTILGKPSQPKQDPKLGVDEPSLSRFDPSTPAASATSISRARR